MELDQIVEPHDLIVAESTSRCTATHERVGIRLRMDLGDVEHTAQNDTRWTLWVMSVW